jgi:hypothetical protein
MPALIPFIGLLSLSFVQAAAPSPKPRVVMTPVPKGQRVQVKPRNPVKEVVIMPKTSAKLPATSFELRQTGPGKLTLVFVSRDPNLELNTRGSFIAQLTTEEPLEVEPSVITRSKWPVGATQTTLTFKGAAAGQPNLIEGEVGYLYCHKATKACTQAVSPVKLVVQP